MIEGMKAQFPVSYLCGRFGVSESGFYAWRSRPQSASSKRWSLLLAKVLGVFIESGRADGHRKIREALAADHALPVNRKTVLKAMRSMGLMPPAAQAAFRRAAACARVVADPPDLLNRRFDFSDSRDRPRRRHHVCSDRARMAVCRDSDRSGHPHGARTRQWKATKR